MINATTTTHEISSKKSRKSQPPKVAAPSFANDAGPSQSRNENASASATKTSTAIQRHGAWRSGNNSHTVANTAGITSAAMTPTSHHRDNSGRRSWTAK